MTSVFAESSKLILKELYHQLLRHGVQYFVPSSHLELLGSVDNKSVGLVFQPTSESGLYFDWLGQRYELTNHEQFTDHQKRMVRSIAEFISARHQLLFDRELAAQNMPLFRGLTEDRYVSAFLSQNAFADLQSSAVVRDRIIEAIEVLRISALSSYEDKRIATGALLFGSWPDACHSIPAKPEQALPYSSELTSIRSFHRICDGLRTVALVDAQGYMVEVIDLQEWAEPFRDLSLPVPTARRYRTHSQATMCGGHICLVLTPNGEIKIFGEGIQLFSFFDGRWNLTDAVSKYQAWEKGVGHKDLAERLFSVALNLAEYRRGGMFVVLEDSVDVRQLVSPPDLLETGRATRVTAKNQLHYLLRQACVTELSPAVLETIAQIDGSVVMDSDARLLAFGAILRQKPQMGDDEDIGEGGRTAAAIGASLFANVLMVSEGGQLSFYQKGHCIWTL